MRVFILCLLTGILLLHMWPTYAGSAIYRYVDKRGRVHYTDTPPTRNSRPHIKPQARSNTLRIYRYVDKKGVVHFSDRALHARYKLIYQGTAHLRGYGKKLSIHKKYALYKKLVDEAAKKTGVEAALIHAVIQTESAYNPRAVSPKGATGLMQLMKGTADRYGVVDRKDPIDNIDGGTRYLRDLLKMFNYNKHLALAAYNAGEGAVQKHDNMIPPYKETQNYVRRVLALYRLHKAKK